VVSLLNDGEDSINTEIYLMSVESEELWDDAENPDFLCNKNINIYALRDSTPTCRSKNP
jgi:hypothetical protein